ncbi:MAG: helix-turn-helix transcriptional regulator [Rhizobiaceae bacterium]|nr:helix-turn-helix transcriptional regulator [Rhizobiaceae bacterium]
MMAAIKLYRGEFGHVSVLSVASDFVTHAHPEAQLIVWLDGTAGEMTIGGETVRLGAGMAAGINPFEPHSHQLSGDGEPGQFLNLYLDPEWVRMRRAGRSAPFFARPAIPLEPWLRHAALSMIAQAASDEAPTELAAYEMERLVETLVEAAEGEQPAAVRRTGAPAMDHRVRKAMALMSENVCERICFDSVARSVGLSRPHFFALFKEQTNLTPNVYWNTLRMEEARRQLQGSEEPLISVACNLGFTTQGNFSRFFRDHFGVPPTLYREAARASA